MNKTDLIQKIKLLEGISQDERAYLINLVNTKKKYGLVWEDKPEDAEEQLRTHLPVLKEVTEKRIIATPPQPEAPPQPSPKGRESGKAVQNLQQSLFEPTNIEKCDSSSPPSEGLGEAHSPNHILIEGDNLHALTALTFTHEGKIDVIYIDPPYNTGNKDFKYNDSYVDKEDSYRHSKWLSFMNKRLEIAKRLLKNEGVILISIDDNEAFQLKLLCDEIFLDNFICCVPRITKSSGKTTNKIALNHDYILVYAKNKESAIIEGLDHYDSGFKYSDNHINKRGLYKLNQTLDYDSLQYSTSLDYEIEIDGAKFYPGTDYSKFIDRKNGDYSRADWAWRWSKDLYEFGLANDFIVVKTSKKGSRIYTKTYLQAKIGKDSTNNYFVDYFDRKKPITSLDFTNANYSNDNAKKDLDKVIKQSIFDYPKPLSILNTFLKTNPLKEIKILDFFAGSGTTLHATMQLNAEDGGTRQCIMVTNNENNICEEVTYERNRRVIQGYINSKGEWVSGLTNNNLRYYKSEFVGREPSLKNKRELTRLATELLCIKEDCYIENCLNQDGEGLKDWQDEGVSLERIKKALKHDIRLFSENEKNILVVYNDEMIEDAVALIKHLKYKSWESMNPINHGSDNLINVYVFSPGQYPFTEEFEEVLPYITLCALPDAIYKAFLNVLPKKKHESIPELEEDVVESQPELFD